MLRQISAVLSGICTRRTLLLISLFISVLTGGVSGRHDVLPAITVWALSYLTALSAIVFLIVLIRGIERQGDPSPSPVPWAALAVLCFLVVSMLCHAGPPGRLLVALTGTASGIAFWFYVSEEEYY
ncbi:TPA: hypothetical protein ACNV1G_004550 [Citrobacter amalonaticus]